MVGIGIGAAVGVGVTAGVESDDVGGGDDCSGGDGSFAREVQPVAEKTAMAIAIDTNNLADFFN